MHNLLRENIELMKIFYCKMRLKSIPHNAVLYTSNGDFMYKRIRDLREDNGVTQKQVSAYLHCCHQVYNNYWLGQRDIPTAVLIALAKFYNTSTDYILGLTDEK